VSVRVRIWILGWEDKERTAQDGVMVQTACPAGGIDGTLMGY